jgi:hypothetical protein
MPVHYFQSTVIEHISFLEIHCITKEKFEYLLLKSEYYLSKIIKFNFCGQWLKLSSAQVNHYYRLWKL